MSSKQSKSKTPLGSVSKLDETGSEAMSGLLEKRYTLAQEVVWTMVGEFRWCDDRTNKAGEPIVSRNGRHLLRVLLASRTPDGQFTDFFAEWWSTADAQTTAKRLPKRQLVMVAGTFTRREDPVKKDAKGFPIVYRNTLVTHLEPVEGEERD